MTRRKLLKKKSARDDNDEEIFSNQLIVIKITALIKIKEIIKIT